jgi:DNA topoisomerase-3
VDCPIVRVQSVESKETKRSRPQPLNTVELLKQASKVLGIGPHAAMGVAERLYLMGYLSYPRTESTAYPKSFDYKHVVEQHARSSEWGRSTPSRCVDGRQSCMSRAIC